MVPRCFVWGIGSESSDQGGGVSGASMWNYLTQRERRAQRGTPRGEGHGAKPPCFLGMDPPLGAGCRATHERVEVEEFA